MDEKQKKEAIMQVVMGNVKNLHSLFPQKTEAEIKGLVVNACKKNPQLLNLSPDTTTGPYGSFCKNVSNLKILAPKMEEEEIKEKWLNACIAEPKLFIENPVIITGKESTICINRHQIPMYLEDPSHFFKEE